MYEELISELGKQISVLSDIMNQLAEISKRIPPEHKQKMKQICDADLDVIKKLQKIHEKMSELKREKE